MSMHSVNGGPLNYGQRVSFLRRLYIDDIRTIYERLASARIGLKASGIATMRPIPLWTVGTSHTLFELVEWVRDAVRQVEYQRRKEITYTMTIT